MSKQTMQAAIFAVVVTAFMLMVLAMASSTCTVRHQRVLINSHGEWVAVATWEDQC